MTRISALTFEQASPAALTLLQGVKSKIGMVPNLFSTLAHAPAALNGYMQLDASLKTGTLSQQDREVISLSVGQFNRCGYCLSAHTLMGKGAGLSPEAIAAARQGDGSAVAKLAVQVAETRGNVSDADLVAARAAGLSDAQILEVVAGVALNILTNYVNNLAQTEIDFPKVAV